MRGFLIPALAAACLAVAAPATAAPAAAIAEAGGSDLVAIDLDPSRLVGSDAGWRDSAVFHTPACQYDRLRDDTDRELMAMRQAGQKKLGFNLWYMHLDKSADCAGFALNSAGGRFTPLAIANLNALMAKAADLGFDEVQVRFSPLANNRVESWKNDWNQAMFEENWGVIDSTIAAIGHPPGIRVIYDLDGEQAGTECPHCHEYVRRIWANYVRKYPVSESYGFSIAIAPHRVAELLADLRSAGPLPTQIAIDTYDAAAPGLRVAAEEMRAAGVNLPILVQETLYDSPAMYQALIAQAREYGVTVRAVMQWPLDRRHVGHINQSSTINYIYLPAR